MIRAIIIPADTSEPCSVTSLDRATWRTAMTEILGDLPSPATYDRDVTLWLADDARGELPNLRATRYAFGQSEAAARNRTNPDRPPYYLHGTVIVTGSVPGGFPGETPRRIFTLFGLGESATNPQVASERPAET